MREIRKARGLTLQKLADALDTSNQNIQRMESGHRRATADALLAVAAVLECSVSELLGETAFVPRCPLLFYAVAGLEIDLLPGNDGIDSNAPPLVPLPRRWEVEPGDFAVEILDDSADRLYPPGTFLFCKPPGGAIPHRARCVVHNFTTNPRDALVFETRVMLAGLSGDGADIVLTAPTNNPRKAMAAVLHRGTWPSGILDTGSALPFDANDHLSAIDYEARPHDIAEIVGVVQASLQFERASG